MPDATDWKQSLTATDRYENIQRMTRQQAIDAGGTQRGSAFSIENEAYTDSVSRAAYDSACDIFSAPGPDVNKANHTPQIDEHFAQSDDSGDDSGDGSDTGATRIGTYRNCRYVASGATAEVYRCSSKALKVIVETHNIAPHDPVREARILSELKRPCIPLLETFRDQEQRFVLVFPYMPLSLADMLERGALGTARVKSCFRDILTALKDIHSQGIIHRDIKPSAVLLESPDGPACLSDFGTAWHPRLSAAVEPANGKILDIGTGPYRAPEVLFGDRSYGTAVDMWGVGTMLAECCPDPPHPLFESRAAHEDGNQLGLILSIFKTIGSPTRETWPEAGAFKTPPFEMYRAFEGKPWGEVLRGVEPGLAELVVALVKFESGSRATAKLALQHESLR